MRSDIFELQGETYFMGNRKCYIATLLVGMERDAIGKTLIGTDLNGETIIAVESFALVFLSAGTQIGIMTDYKLENK